MRPRIALGKLKAFTSKAASDRRLSMRESWPHAPPHYFTPHGAYVITAATLYRKPLFDSDVKLDLFRDTTFELARNYALILQAWAFFANHYHLVASFENTETTHRDFVRHLHRELTMRLNRIHATPHRRVMYEFWDTHLTFEKSWLARLNYVHQNPVKHRLALVANQYRWCSAAWFESNARSGFVKSVYSFKTDLIKVPDDF
jgi:putative transposase